MPTQTVRRNALKTIRDLFAGCALVTSYKYDDSDTSPGNSSVSASVVLAVGSSLGFDRVYRENDDDGRVRKVVARIHQNYFFTGYATQEDARASLTFAAFAEHFPEAAAIEIAAEEAQHLAACQAEAAAEAAAHAQLTTDQPQPVFYIGQRIIATFAALNKNGSIARYLRECAQPEDGEQIWQRTHYQARKNWRVAECEVQKIITMTAAEYDHFSCNVMESRQDLFAAFAGGTDSAFNCGREIAEFWQMTDAEQEKWKAASWQVVAVIEAPGRVSVVVNPEGYGYARYVGIAPRALFPVATSQN